MSRSAIALLAVGLLQMAGDALHLLPLKAIGAATAASPAPKVFTSLRGLEAFSCRFFVEWDDKAGGRGSLAMTPAVYERLRGPYNRRNVFGAVLAAGPVLSTDRTTEPLYKAVTRYALCGEAPVLRELGLDPARFMGPPRIRYEPRPGFAPGDLPLLLTAPCS